MSYIGLHRSDIQRQHYIMNATASNHWYNFYDNKVKSYIQRFRDNFCLIINGSHDYDDAYILPFRRFKDFFSSDYLDKHNRWVGTIKENRIRLTSEGRLTKSLSIGAYYNAFNLLDVPEKDDQLFAPADIVVVANHDELQLSDLGKLIEEFNRLYVSVKPQKRLMVSEAVARPNAITDYLKRLQRYICQICGLAGFPQRNGSLYIETHHIIELHRLVLGSYCSDNIIVVCPTCHKKLHYANVAYAHVNERVVSVTINKVRTSFERNIITAKQLGVRRRQTLTSRHRRIAR